MSQRHYKISALVKIMLKSKIMKQKRRAKNNNTTTYKLKAYFCKGGNLS